MQKERHKNDLYETPVKLTEILLNHVSIEGRILEPCAGNNAIANVLREQPGIHAVVSTDIANGKLYLNDATTKEYWEFWAKGMDWVVTNPPFSKAQEILPHTLPSVKKGVAVLLRLTYLEPCKKRADWLKENADHLRYVIPLNPRPKFRDDTKNSDKATVAWYVWKKDWSWKERRITCPFIFVNKWR